MALLVAEDVLYMEARAESARAEEVRQRVLTLERRWRDDITTSELPSINFTVKHASDLVCVQGMFALFIHHVDSLPHGRGFKPVLRHGDWTCETGEVHLGTDEQAHIAAQAEGEEILLRQVQDLAAALQQQDILERRFHSPKRPVKKIRK